MPSPSSVFLARSAALAGFKEVAETAGHDPIDLVQCAGLPLTCLREPELRIPTVALLRLLETAAALPGLSDIGLNLALSRPNSSLGAFGLLLREQATVRDMIRAMCANIWVQFEGLVFALEEADDLAFFSVEFVNTRGQACRQATELSVANVMRRIQACFAPDWRPEMVTFRHPKPASLALHTRLFGVTPLFGQDQNAIVLAIADLSAPIPSADPAAAEHLARYMAMLSAGHAPAFDAQVKRLVAAMLPRGMCRMDVIARQLGIHPRTLHRQLEREHTSFGTILNEVRVELLQTYRRGEARSMTEISELLGFSSLSAFSRWKRGAVPPQ
ncbi:MAG: hypothetical protein RLZZ84_1123 [Pseudomonadota bacterium]